MAQSRITGTKEYCVEKIWWAISEIWMSATYGLLEKEK